MNSTRRSAQASVAAGRRRRSHRGSRGSDRAARSQANPETPGLVTPASARGGSRATPSSPMRGSPGDVDRRAARSEAPGAPATANERTNASSPDCAVRGAVARTRLAQAGQAGIGLVARDVAKWGEHGPRVVGLPWASSASAARRRRSTSSGRACSCTNIDCTSSRSRPLATPDGTVNDDRIAPGGARQEPGKRFPRCTRRRAVSRLRTRTGACESRANRS